MFTTCPKCALNLAITAADLRVGQGYVRCGRCANVFNALVGLADDDEGPRTASAPPAAKATSEEAHAVELTSASAGPPAAEPVEPVADAGPGAGEPAILVESSLVEGDPGTGTFETIILEGEGVTQTTEVVNVDEVDEQLLALAQQLEAAKAEADAIPVEDGGEVQVLELLDEAAEPPPAAADARAPDRPPLPAADAAAQSAAGDPADLGELPDEAEARIRLLRNLTLLGSVLLGLLLIVQLVHHYRAPLATGPLADPLGSLYAALGLSLQPDWDLAAYELRQLGARSSGGEQIQLRASVRNGAARAQPLPVLRVTLQDRFGNAIERRDVAPPDYLRGATDPLLGPDQRVDADITLRDPGQNAVGFELDVCLPADRGSLACAEERAQRR